MSAETLRRAAALMRERAGAARTSPWQVDGPWWHQDDELGGHDATSMVTSGEDRRPVAVPVGRDLNDPHDRDADMAHIAAWHPDVALFVADWLDEEAVSWLPGDESLDYFHPYVIACTYLGEQP